MQLIITVGTGKAFMENKPPIIDAEVSGASSEFRPNVTPRARLGIIHLLLWMLMTAVLLAVQRALLEPTSTFLFTVYNMLLAPIHGAAIGGALVLVTRLVRGQYTAVLGGHYLLLMCGLLAVLMSCVSTAMNVANRDHDLPIGVHFGVYGAIEVLDLMLALVLAALCFRQLHWMGFFLLTAVRNFVNATSYLLQYIVFEQRQLRGLQALPRITEGCSQLFIVLSILVLVACIVVDARRKAPRDWLYWTGIAVWLLTYVALFALRIVLWIQFPQGWRRDNDSI